jgi:hypothetical protein
MEVSSSALRIGAKSKTGIEEVFGPIGNPNTIFLYTNYAILDVINQGSWY